MTHPNGKLRRNNQMALNAAGVTFHPRRQYDRAMDECRKGLQIEPAFRNILVYWARTYGLTDQYEQAIADFETDSNARPATLRRLPDFGDSCDCRTSRRGRTAV